MQLATINYYHDHEKPRIKSHTKNFPQRTNAPSDQHRPQRCTAPRALIISRSATRRSGKTTCAREILFSRVGETMLAADDNGTSKLRGSYTCEHKWELRAASSFEAREQ